MVIDFILKYNVMVIQNEKEFEKFNLISSKKLDIPLIATNEVFI